MMLLSLKQWHEFSGDADGRTDGRPATATEFRLKDRSATATNLHWWLGGHPRQPLQQQRSHSSTVFRCFGALPWPMPSVLQRRASDDQRLDSAFCDVRPWQGRRFWGITYGHHCILGLKWVRLCEPSGAWRRIRQASRLVCVALFFSDPMPIKRVVNCAAKSHLCDYCTEMVQILELELFFICILNFFLH